MDYSIFILPHRDHHPFRERFPNPCCFNNIFCSPLYTSLFWVCALIILSTTHLRKKTWPFRNKHVIKYNKKWRLQLPSQTVTGLACAAQSCFNICRLASKHPRSINCRTGATGPDWSWKAWIWNMEYGQLRFFFWQAKIIAEFWVVQDHHIAGKTPRTWGGRVLYRISGPIFPAVVKRYQPQPCQVSKKPNLGRCSANEKFEKSFWNHIYIYIYKYLENIVYHCFRQLWLVLWVKLMEINSNLFSGYTQMTEVFNFF